MYTCSHAKLNVRIINCRCARFQFNCYSDCCVTLPVSNAALPARDRLYTSESDVCRRQILKSTDSPDIIELFIMTVGIQMEWKQLNITFMMILNWLKEK